MWKAVSLAAIQSYRINRRAISLQFRSIHNHCPVGHVCENPLLHPRRSFRDNGHAALGAVAAPALLEQRAQLGEQRVDQFLLYGEALAVAADRHRSRKHGGPSSMAEPDGRDYPPHWRNTIGGIIRRSPRCMPVTSAAICAAVTRNVPSVGWGHAKPYTSTARFVISHIPVPSNLRFFSRSFRLLRYTWTIQPPRTYVVSS